MAKSAAPTTRVRDPEGTRRKIYAGMFFLGRDK